MRTFQIMTRREIALFTLFVFSATPAAHADAAVQKARMEEVVVTAAEDRPKTLPDVDGAKIYSGKKTAIVDVQDAPAIVNNNYRQAFEKTPGLLVSEETTPLVSIGYRGLNPDRAQFMQVLKDGVPIQADIFGYPEAYYTPPLEGVDHIDFVHGGSALMYGPQPGGAINYVTKDPYPGAFEFATSNSVGSHDFYSNYTSVSGTQGVFGHTSYFHHRQSQGFRDSNSQYAVYYGGSKITIAEDPTSRWTVAFDLYDEEHGEPGGLTRAQFDTDPEVSTRLADRFHLERYYGSVAYLKEVDTDTTLDWKAFGGYYGRYSWRQRGGGFGTVATGAAASTNDIQEQEFYTVGTEGRWKREYDAFGHEGHALSVGALYYHSTSPRVEKRGTTADADDGALRKDSDRQMNYVSVFAENLFRFGKLSITPGVRLENIWQSIEENLNVDKTTAPLADESEYDFVPLFGVGAEYEVSPALEIYGNVSQSYRPKVYADAVPLGTNQVVGGDLEEGESWQAEAGLRGRPTPWLFWDVSVFHLVFEDQTGTVGNTIQNVGDAEHDGAEAALEVGLCRLLAAAQGREHDDRFGEFGLYSNVTYLDARFEQGPNVGMTPQYAPDYILRGGVEYAFRDRGKVRLGATFLDDHFADDSNSAQRAVPSYKVWDLTAEWKIYKEMVTLFGGINNLFDEEYYARVTSAGIDPADGRNYYGGASFRW